MSAAPKYASQAPDDFQESTGLADNFDATISGFKFTDVPPSESYTTEGTPLFSNWSFTLEGGEVVSQSYSMGATAGANFDISSDGYGLLPKSDDSTLRKDSKHGTIIASLATEGLPKAILQSGDMSKLIGLKGHFKRVADKERSFTSERAGAKKRFPPSTLVCTRIISLPGVGAVAKNEVPARATALPDLLDRYDDIDTRAGQYLAQVVKARKGSVQRSQLLLLVSKAAADGGDVADKAAIAKRSMDEGFLKSISDAGGVVDLNGDVVAISYDSASKPQVVTIAA